MGDAHSMASASRSVIERPKPKAHPREEDRCPHLICTTLLPKSRRCLPSIVSGTRLWRISYSQNIRTRLSVGDYTPYQYPCFGLFSAPSSPILSVKRGGKR